MVFAHDDLRHRGCTRRPALHRPPTSLRRWQPTSGARRDAGSHGGYARPSPSDRHAASWRCHLARLQASAQRHSPATTFGPGTAQQCAHPGIGILQLTEHGDALLLNMAQHAAALTWKYGGWAWQHVIGEAAVCSETSPGMRREPARHLHGWGCRLAASARDKELVTPISVSQHVCLLFGTSFLYYSWKCLSISLLSPLVYLNIQVSGWVMR